MNTVWKTTNRTKWQLTTVLTITPEREKERERDKDSERWRENLKGNSFPLRVI